jgi:SAM-dependent methyltransferase
MKISHHTFQARMKNYLSTRGTTSNNYKKMINEICVRIKNNSHILVLGCNNGKNDVVPLISFLINHKKHNKFIIDAIDNSEEIIELKKHLQSMNFIESGNTLRLANIVVELFHNDIDTYPKNIFRQKGKYDFVISFFVLNHIVNWKFSINKISYILKNHGKLYLLHYDRDFYIEAIENNEKISNPFLNVINFHNERFKLFDSYFTNSLLGSDLDSLRSYCLQSFSHKIIKTIKYKRTVDARRRISSKYPPHTALFWGQHFFINSNGIEQLTESYESFLKFYEGIKEPAIQYNGTIHLNEFKKNEIIKSKLNDWDYEFRNISKNINKLNLDLIDNSSKKHLISKFDKMVLQLILGNQGLVQESNFFSTLFWNMKESNEQLKVDIKNPNTTFETLIPSKEYFSSAFHNYLIHLLIIRNNDVKESNEELYSLADIIYDYSKSDYDWIIGVSDTNEFSCEMLENENQIFLTIGIPQKYLKTKAPKNIDLIKALQNVPMMKLNNFNIIDLSTIFSSFSSVQIKEFENMLFDYELINSDFEKEQRRQKIKEVFNTKYWKHLSIMEKEKIVELILKRIPRFIYLSKIGTTINFTNSLYKHFNKTLNEVQSYGNGGFFLNEKIKLTKLKKELKNSNSFTALRFKFLKDILNIYTSKRIIPFIGYQYITAEKERGRSLIKSGIISILVDSYAHNISAHSLVTLKWWFEKRAIALGENIANIKTLISHLVIGYPAQSKEINGHLYNLLTFLSSITKNLSFLTKTSTSDDKETTKLNNIGFPLPLDYSLYHYFRYLRDKGAFWSAITRDESYGGESKTLFDVLYKNFASNQLLLGTIASSEEVYRVNIYIAIRKDKKKWFSGRFVSIDLSLVSGGNNSEQFQEDFNLCESNNIKNNRCQNFDNNYIEENDNSPYSFTRKGPCFNCIKDQLKECNVFFPGGIIGEHSFFTILENTLRNVKHFKKKQIDEMKNKGVDLWISIEEEKLTDKSKEKELYNIGVWLNHSVHPESKNKEYEYLVEELDHISEKPILKENQSPRMGGNSQDKICAAMLLNNNFTSVEDNGSARGEPFYPWIRFASAMSKNNLKDIPQDVNKVGRRKNYINEKYKFSKEIYDKNIKKNNKLKKKEIFLKKYIKLWKTGEILKDQNKNQLDNFSRYRFRINENKNNNSFVLRSIDKTKLTDERDLLANCYSLWLKKWIGVNNNEIILRVGSFAESNGAEELNPALEFKYLNQNIIINKTEEEEGDNTIFLGHGDTHFPGKTISIKGQGQFWTKYMPENIKPKNLDGLVEYVEDKQVFDQLYLFELLEVIKTKAVVFDKRISNLILGQNNEQVLRSQLNLDVKSESESEWIEYKKMVKKFNTFPNFLIMHLSFIKDLKSSEGKSYGEDGIQDFIINELEEIFNLSDRENMFFIITTGMGKHSWEFSEDSKYKYKVLHKPVESLVNGIESGLSISDDFDIKNSIIKSIFGS